MMLYIYTLFNQYSAFIPQKYKIWEKSSLLQRAKKNNPQN